MQSRPSDRLQSVHRRTGGLENLDQVTHFGVLVHRRTGGLENSNREQFDSA